MNWIERNGVSLRYEHRSGSGPTLVLVHEMGGTLESWEEIVPRLAGNVPVICFDGRGSGLSTKLRREARIEDLAADIGIVLEAACVYEPVILAGIAVGGAVALHFASRNPDRVAGLVPFGPATGVDADRRATTLARAEAVEGAGMGAIAEAALSQSYPQALRDEVGRFERLRARWLGNDPGSYAAILRLLAGLDMRDDLAAIRCPTLVLAGRNDLVRPPDTVRLVADQIPGARFDVIDSGHFASIQAPAAFAEALAGFLREIGR